MKAPAAIPIERQTAVQELYECSERSCAPGGRLVVDCRPMNTAAPYRQCITQPLRLRGTSYRMYGAVRDSAVASRACVSTPNQTASNAAKKAPILTALRMLTERIITLADAERLRASSEERDTLKLFALTKPQLLPERFEATDVLATVCVMHSCTLPSATRATASRHNTTKGGKRQKNSCVAFVRPTLREKQSTARQREQP